MPNPEYSQSEADWLISLEKLAALEGEIYDVLSRYRPGFSCKVFEAGSEIEQSPPVRFRIRTEANISIGAYCIVLEASIGSRPLAGICRYDVHDSLHNNNCSCCDPPPQILPGQFHAHWYNECTIRRGNNWDKCGVTLEIDEDIFKRQIRQLIGVFIEDMKLKFSDSGTIGSLFESGAP